MMKYIKLFFDNEVLSYLFFGVAATLVYMVTRLLFYSLFGQLLVSIVLANIAAVLFAFFTNDTFVFKQKKIGRLKRLLKFSAARISTFLLDLLLGFLLVQAFPMIIGQFVSGNLQLVNAIETVFAQVLVIVLNYAFSKIFVFTTSKNA